MAVAEQALRHHGTVLGGLFEQLDNATGLGRVARVAARALRREVFAEHGFLALVMRPCRVTVELVGFFDHPLERELADRLTVLNHERNVAGTYFQGGS